MKILTVRIDSEFLKNNPFLDELKHTIVENKSEGEGDMKLDEEKDSSYANQIDTDIKELRNKIKEIENKLKELRNSKSPKQLPPTNSKESDYTTFMYDLSERLETLEGAHENTIETLGDHSERIEKLEKDSDDNKEKIINNKNDINELKDTMADKVDCDLFDSEIAYLKELLNQLGTGEKVDISQIPPPKAGMSTKDANKLKELAAKVPELEKLINDILERLGRAERGIENHEKSIKNHDKSIEEIWAELAKKGNANDLKDLFDRLNQLEKDLENVVNYMNNMDKGTPTALPTVGSNTDDKRLKHLEEKVEDLRSHLSSSLRDVNKTIDALNSELKGTNQDLSNLKSDLLKLMKKVNNLEVQLDALSKRDISNDNPIAVQPGVDPEKLEDLKRQLNEVRKDYRNFKNEALNEFSNVNKELNHKANIEDLQNLKNLLMNRLDDLEKALNKTKNDLKRALRILHEKVSLSIVIN